MAQCKEDIQRREKYKVPEEHEIQYTGETELNVCVCMYVGTCVLKFSSLNKTGVQRKLEFKEICHQQHKAQTQLVLLECSSKPNAPPLLFLASSKSSANS